MVNSQLDGGDFVGKSDPQKVGVGLFSTNWHLTDRKPFFAMIQDDEIPDKLCLQAICQQMAWYQQMDGGQILVVRCESSSENFPPWKPR